MAKYIFNEGSERRIHNLFEGYTTFYYLELEEDFGRGEFNRINDQLEIFEVTYWSKDKGATKGYKLTPQVLKIRANYLKQSGHRRSKTSKLADVKMENGQTMRKPPKPIRTQGNGNIENAWRGSQVAGLIPIDGEMLRIIHAQLKCMELESVTGDLFSNPSKKKITRHREAAEKLLAWADTDVAGRDCIMHYYEPSAAGRLYAQGSVTLQNAPRLLRKAALHGLHDYDFDNCHYRIAKQLAEAYGQECPAISHYVSNKDPVRQGIAERVDISLDNAKHCLMALLYGATISEWPESAIPETIDDKDRGIYRSKDLYLDHEFKGIASEVKALRKTIIDCWPHKSRTHLHNALGGILSLEEPKKELLAHLLQGIEAKALKVAIETYPDDVVLLMHDGFITTRPIDAEVVQAQVKEHTGYDLPLNHERVEIPPHLDLSE